jgi:hypothetical protein
VVFAVVVVAVVVAADGGSRNILRCIGTIRCSTRRRSTSTSSINGQWKRERGCRSIGSVSKRQETFSSGGGWLWGR